MFILANKHNLKNIDGYFPWMKKMQTQDTVR